VWYEKKTVFIVIAAQMDFAFKAFGHRRCSFAQSATSSFSKNYTEGFV